MSIPNPHGESRPWKNSAGHLAYPQIAFETVKELQWAEKKYGRKSTQFFPAAVKGSEAGDFLSEKFAEEHRKALAEKKGWEWPAWNQPPIVEFLYDKNSDHPRRFIVPPHESVASGDILSLLLDYEAATRTRLKNDGNPREYIRIRERFDQSTDKYSGVSFAEYCAKRVPDEIETVLAPQSHSKNFDRMLGANALNPPVKYQDPHLSEYLNQKIELQQLEIYGRFLREVAERYERLELYGNQSSSLREMIKSTGIPAAKCIRHLIYARADARLETLSEWNVEIKSEGQKNGELSIKSWDEWSWWYVGTWVFAFVRDSRLFPVPRGFGDREIHPVLTDNLGQPLAEDLKPMPVGPIKDRSGKITKIGWQKKAATVYDVMNESERLDWERKRCRDWAFLCRGFAGIAERYFDRIVHQTILPHVDVKPVKPKQESSQRPKSVLPEKELRRRRQLIRRLKACGNDLKECQKKYANEYSLKYIRTVRGWEQTRLSRERAKNK